MSAITEKRLDLTLGWARNAKLAVALAQRHERRCVVDFIREARREGWSWKRIGEALGTSDVAARRFYGRNRR